MQRGSASRGAGLESQLFFAWVKHAWPTPHLWQNHSGDGFSGGFLLVVLVFGFFFLQVNFWVFNSGNSEQEYSELPAIHLNKWIRVKARKYLGIYLKKSDFFYQQSVRLVLRFLFKMPTAALPHWFDIYWFDTVLHLTLFFWGENRSNFLSTPFLHSSGASWAFPCLSDCGKMWISVK